MSVTPMKKLTVLCTRGDADKLVRRLMHMRCVEISEQVPDEASGTRANPVIEIDRAALERSVQETSEAIRLLTPYAERKKSLFQRKREVDRAAFTAGIRYGAAKKIRDDALTVRTQLETCQSAQEKNREAQQALEPWADYDVPLADKGTKYTEVILGSLPATLPFDMLKPQFDEAGACLELVGADTTCYYVSLVYGKTSAEPVERVMSKTGLVRVNLKESAGLPAVELARLRDEESRLDGEAARLSEELRAKAESLDELEILYDVEQTSLDAAREQTKLCVTRYCVTLGGWVPTPRADSVAEMLNYMDCAYAMEDPGEEDDVPVLLHNNGYAKTFEWVLGMYAYPTYGRFDPTFIMSIFYFFIFGLMFADVGYGLILTLGGFIGAKLMGKKANLYNMLMMFGYCGISCMIMGVLFGAYFGDLPLTVMRNMMGMTDAEMPNLALIRPESPTLAVLLDPVSSPMEFLIISLAVGGVHLIAGMAVKFVILCRDGQVMDAICDIGFYWVLFAGIGIMAMGWGWYVLAAGAALIVLTHGRAEKNPLMKVAKGLLGLYDLINFASDLLSYSRILALGLAAGVVAQVVNILATIGGPSVGGFVLMVVVGLVGHLLNLALNVLGTFVHTSRLQYIEFFGKFYEDGGRQFTAAAPCEKYSLDESPADVPGQ